MWGIELTGTEVGLVAAIGAVAVGVYVAEVQRRAAKADRIWQRKADAYLELAHVAGRLSHVVQSLMPMMDTNPPTPLPSAPSSEDQARATVLVALFGSAEVRLRHAEWNEALLRGISCWRTAQFARGTPDGVTYRSRLNLEYQPAEITARRRLEAAMAAELGNREPGDIDTWTPPPLDEAG